MAARGSLAKAEIIEKLLNTFEGSFLYNDGKEIRIPMLENGEQLQIKVTLTCAKENVSEGADTAIPTLNTPATKATVETKAVDLTEQEIKEVRNLIEQLNL